MEEKKNVCLRVENVSKVFAKVDGDELTHALRDVSTEMRSGEFVSLVGPSGCGKSTMLRLIAGLIQPTTGTVTVDGREIKGPAPDRGMMFQKATLFPWLTVWDNIAFSLKMQGTLADHLGYFAEAGLTAEGVKGSSDVEALGAGQVDVATGMMAKMLVPITNGVDITFTGGAHIGCKSLYVLANSDYNTTADLKGQKISVPNGIGKSDYNITALLLDADGINYSTDVELVQVSSDACVAAMENGEIACALLSDTYAYAMVKEGTLKCIRSQLDSDFADRVCCVMAMNGTFVKENPTIAKKVAQAVQKAHAWMRDNSDEATKVLMDKGWNGGNYEMNIMINNSLQFGLSDAFTEDTLKDFISRYVRLGLITSMSDEAEILELAWTPVL